ncbi:MAG: terminase [Nannocystis sp.]|nr:terminase [Nannocystis sp.]
MTATATAEPQAALYTHPSGFNLYGAARELWNFKGSEVILAGPYECGKTIAWLHKMNAVMCKYPNARGLMLRKTYRSLIESACITFEREVLANPPGHPDCPIDRAGGSNPTAYEYPNGSRIVLGGMDNPSKLLSSAWDMIGVPQAEELTESEWGSLTRPITGRAGNVQHPQIVGDANPGPPTHWILHRPSLTVLHSRHEDNPTLFDPATGEITERGKKTMAVLDALPGVLYQRGRLGKWVSAEGQVYDDFDRAIHLIDSFPIPSDWTRYWAVDFGYTNPFAWGEFAVDHDGRLYLVREIYRTRRLVEDHARHILAITHGSPQPQALICDTDAEDRATLERHLNVRTIAADKAISTGIQAVQMRLKKAGDGRPRLYIMRDALVERDEALAAAHRPVCTLDEFEVYVWPKGRDGSSLKEAPVKEFDHGLDRLRYMAMYLEAGMGGPPPKTTEDFNRANRPEMTYAEMEW